MHIKKSRQFRKGICWKVGDDTSINFWHDNWCDNENLIIMCGITNTSPLDMSLKVLDMITSIKEWNVAKLHLLLDNTHLQVILPTPISFSSASDSICSGLLSNDDFSTKTATWTIEGGRGTNSLSSKFNWI